MVITSGIKLYNLEHPYRITPRFGIPTSQILTLHQRQIIIHGLTGEEAINRTVGPPIRTVSLLIVAIFMTSTS